MIIFTREISEFIYQNSARPAVEYQKFEELINSRKPLTFYNWECPVRSSVRPVNDSQLELECDFFDDESSIEKTRLVKFASEERNIVERVLIPLRDGLGVKVKYFKFLADTNPFILYPNTCTNDKNKNEIIEKMRSFTQKLQNRADLIAGRGNIQIYQFSQVYALYNGDYSRAYNGVYSSFSNEEVPQTKLIKNKYFKNELRELASHTGISSENEKIKLNELAKRVASSYAAEEYIIRSALSKTEEFPNPVCISNESLYTFPALANACLSESNCGPWLFLFNKEAAKK